MNTKAKIGLITKILLVLVLTPIGVAYAANFDGIFGGNSTKNDSSEFNMVNEYNGNFCNISNTYLENTIVENKIKQNAFEALSENFRVFCLWEGKHLHHNTYVDSAGNKIQGFSDINGHYAASDANQYVKKIKRYGNITGSTLTYCDLDKIDIPHGNTTLENKSLVYAAAFSESKSKKRNNTYGYREERYQQAIWGYTGENENNYRGDLYYANEAYKEYAKILKKHDCENLKLQERDNAGSTESKNGEYYIVGPFYIGDYAYAEAKGEGKEIEDFSNKNLNKPEIIAGIINGYIKLKDDENNESKEMEFEGNEICIYYGSGCAGEGDRGGNNYIESKEYIKKPETLNNNTYPYPKSTFYIKIKKSKCEGYTKLSSVKFTCRKTKSTGKGATLSLTTTVQEISVNATACTETYTCSGCRASYNTQYNNILNRDTARCHYCDQNGHEHNAECFTMMCLGDSSDTNASNWCKCLTSKCSLFETALYIGKWDVYYGAIDGYTTIYDGEGKGYSMVGEKLSTKTDDGEDRYITRYNYQDDVGPNGAEVWYTTEEFDKAVGQHTHKINCYFGGDNLYKGDINGKYGYTNCGRVEYTRNVHNTANREIHSTACIHDCNGKFVCSEHKVEDCKEVKTTFSGESEENIQPLLIVKNAKTTVKKTSVELTGLDIRFETKVSAEIHINRLKGGTGIPKDSEHEEECDNDDGYNIKNTIPTTKVCRGADRAVEFTGQRSEYESDKAFKKARREYFSNKTYVKKENYKKENKAVVESGDRIVYWLEIRNNDVNNKDMAVQIQVKLPSNIDKEKGVRITQVDKNGNDIGEGVKTINKTRITTEDLPNRKGTGTGKFSKDGNSYIKIESNGKAGTETTSKVYYRITVDLKTAEESYKENPKIATANITGTFRADVGSGSRYYLAPIYNSGHLESEEYFICKKYNVSVDKYITGITRSNGNSIENGEYIVDKVENRNGKTNDIKSANPYYVENGDIVTYTIAVKNGASTSSSADPYYAPKQVKICLMDVLPLEGSELKDISIECGSNLKWSQNGSKLSIDFNNLSGQTTYLTCKVLINKNSETAYNFDIRENKVEITEIKNMNGKSTIGNYITNTATQLTSSDYFRIKEYNVVIDKYISEVQHAESRGGTTETYNNVNQRKSGIDINGNGSADNEKTNNPVSVEYGDKVTYHIRIYNTTNDENNYDVGRENPPYKQPQLVTVNIKDTLPEKYSELNVTYDIEKSSCTPNYTLTDNNRIMNLNNLEVPANKYTTIIVSLVVEEPEKYKVETNTAEINGPIKNINSYNIINNGKRLKVSDKYQLNDYNAKLDEYVYEYDASMEKYNMANGFTSSATGEIKNNGTEDNNSYPNDKPLDVEKYEKATFATKVTNKASGGEAESKNATYAKYNTRVRPTEVTQTLDYGLQVKSRKVIWYNANGTQKQDITSSIGISSVDNKSKRTNTYTYKIKNDDIILSPGEFIVYYTTVEVTESNMCLNNLHSFSQIKTLTNINRNNSQSGNGKSRIVATNNHDRIITDQNIANKKSDEDYVRLKDLVIAGTVWLDSNKDGYNNNNELPKKEVVVKLYRTDQKNPVKTVKTNQNGFYTFGRQWKAKGKDKNNNYNNTEYIKYYVEFEYDGATYKATEVYGGNSTGNADGTGNLYTTKTLDWRQGTEVGNLPGTKTGRTEYLKDSNAYEFDDVRNKFNSEYQTIGFNKSYSNFNSTNTLSYTKNGHTSMLNENSDRTMKARSFIIQNYNMSGNGVQENLDNTKTLFLQDYSGHSNKYPETEYLKFINLGLVRREEVDISIESDVYSVKTTMNGEEMTYDFNKNDADSTKSDYSSQTNAYKLANAYNLNLYTADFNYRNDKYYKDENVLVNYKGNESELTAEVTYRMRITNNKIAKDEPNLPTEDIPVETAINEIAVYYDSNFISKETVEEYLKAQTTVKDKNDTTGLLENKIFNSIRVNYGTEEELNKGTATDIRKCISFKSRYSNNKSATDAKDKGYNVLYLTGNALDNTYLKEGESKYVQLTFVVDKAEINNVLRTLKITDNKDNNMGLEAVTEISAYTTKYSDSYEHKGLAGKYAGLIDRDSNPGNLNLKGVEDYDNYEDDKYKVGVTVGLLDSSTRTITGIVWDDSRSKNVGTEETGIQYLGNGEYNVTDTNDDKANTNPNVTHSNDKPISGVKVSLVEVVQTEDGKYYEYPARDSQGNLIETRTDENGKYTLKDYIPGYYKVRFDYGDDSTREDNIIYNGQDYKSTTYFNDNYYVGSYKTDNIGGSANFEYFDDVKESLKKKNKSDAQDDEIRRLNVNSYSETMTTTQAQVFSETSTHKNALTKNTHMYSESTIFYAKPEERKSSEVNIDATPGDFNTTRLWNITDLDFGLEYRPEASVVLDKDIESLELVTSDNKTLVKLYFKEKDGVKVIDEGKSIGNENVQFMPNDGKNQQGFVYLNMDTDILEGCTIKVDYYMDSSNNSEVDRINQNLDNIRYEKGAVDKKYQEKVYISDNYNANGTAAQLLVSKYYDGYNFNTSTGKETFNYLKKLKKPYKTSNETTINDTKLTGTEYYGMYLGETYYTGEVGDKDIVAKLKVDHILDYIDNDFTFSLDENNTENRMWQTTTTQELKNSKLLDFGKVHLDENENLIDKFGIRYDTDSRSNLALSVDDNKRGNYLDTRTKGGNASLSRFLNTKNAVKDVDKDTEEYTGTINAIATKVLSADDLSKGTGLSYDNLAEVVQYTSLTGRRTTLSNNKNDESSGGVVGNANIFNSWIGYESSEDDTDATEIITISPPTGLTQ